MSKRKLIAWLASASGILLLGGALVGGRVLGPKAVAVKTVRRELVQTVIVSGRVLPPARINIGSLIAGVVASVAVKEGDHVEAGDLLIQLGDAEAQAAVKMARAGLMQAKARIRQLRHITGPVARQAHRQSDANLELARLNYERQLVLTGKGSTPVAQLEEAKRALAVAQSQHDTTALQVTDSGPRGAEHALAVAAYAQAAGALAQAEARADEAHITAAASATVLTRSVEPGELVQPGRTLLVLARDGETQLTVQPDEKNLSELRLGQWARVSADAFPKEQFRAVVSYIAPSIDPQRGTVELRLLVQRPPPYLRPDMTMSVNIEVGRRAQALTVPKDAVLDAPSNAPWVWLIRGNRLEKRRIEVGLRAVGMVEIVQGLAEGDRVALPSGAPWKEGQRVRVSAKAGG